MSYQAGDTYPFSLIIRNSAGTLVDPDALTVSVRAPDATVTDYVYGVDAIVVRASLGVYHANVPLTAPGMWVIAGATENEDQIQGVQIAVSPTPTAGVTFATLAELALRLGKASPDDLTAAQRAQGEFLLEMATGLIVETVDKTDAWAQALDPIARVLRAVCLEATARAMQNPSGVSSESETLGAYSHTSRYEFTSRTGPVGLGLTDDESRLCRRAVYGTNTAGPRFRPGVVDDVIELWETGGIAS